MNKQILRGIILAGLFIVPFVPFFVSSSLFFPFITTKAFAWRIIVEVIFAAWFLLALSDAEYRPRRSKLLYALLIFIAIIGIADAFGAAPLKSFWSNAERMEGFISLLHLGMFYVVISSVFNTLNWRRWWNTSLVASLLMVVYCFFQLLGVLEIHQGGARIDGTLGNAAYLAVYLLFHIFVAFYFLVRDRASSFKWLYIISAIALTVTLYFTATRGAILGLLGGLLVAALFSLRNKDDAWLRKLAKIYVIGFIVLIVAFFALRNTSFVKQSPVLARFSTISLAEWKAEGRSFIWPMALQGVKEHPLLGWGQDNFNYVFNEHYSPLMFRLEPWFDRAHNIFLDWAIAGGLLGLLSYLSLYVLLLYYLWRSGSGFNLSERAVLTGLLAAYFFHNLFVFDHLISYMLFISFLAFVESGSVGERLGGKLVSEDSVKNIALPLTGIALLTVLYFVNIRPIVANTSLIGALQNMQAGNTVTSVALFEKAYGEARLGRPEIVEQIASNATNILSGNLSVAQKNDFFTFARNAVVSQAKDVPTDTRYQMLTGSFLVGTGQFTNGIDYLKQALTLMPEKQAIYFELASAYLAEKDYADALSTLKHAYDLAPEYQDARVAYIVGAIYTGDRGLEQNVASGLPKGVYESDDRIATALYSAGRYSDLVKVFTYRVANNPANPQNLVSLAVAYLKLGQTSQAITTLQTLSNKFPSYKTQADEYIKEIQNGTLKI